MKTSKIYIAICTASLPFMPSSSIKAGIVKVINENKKELDLHIQAQGAMTEDLASYTQTIPAENEYTFTVNKEQLKGKSTYSISGKTNPFFGDACKNLTVDKDYQLTFTNNTLGTTCVTQELEP